jgi:CheY-like chemotaxis protein
MAKQVQQSDTILVVEDDPDHYVLLELAARRAGVSAQLKRAADGNEAMQYLGGAGAFADRGTHPLPTIILSDLKMPRINGLELLQWVRAQPLLKRIPFILFSSSIQASDVNRAYDHGVSSYLLKPAALDDLVQMLYLVTRYWMKINQLPDVGFCHREEVPVPRTRSESLRG